MSLLQRMRRRPLVAAAVIVLLAASLGAGAWHAWQREQARAADAAVLDLLMRQSFDDARGVPLAMRSLEGRVLVLNFWATWCAPCVEEMPELSELHGRMKSRGVEFVGIGIDSPDNIARFEKKLPVGYPLVAAGPRGPELARRLGNPKGFLPFTVVIDRDGRIVERKLGRVDIETLRAHVEEAIRG